MDGHRKQKRQTWAKQGDRVHPSDEVNSGRTKVELLDGVTEQEDEADGSRKKQAASEQRLSCDTTRQQQTSCDYVWFIYHSPAVPFPALVDISRPWFGARVGACRKG
jgi:hypothetical protein